MSSYELKIAELNKRSADISAQLITLDDKYKESAIEAAEGNKAAAKTLEEIEAEVNGLRREQRTITAAVEQVRALQKAKEDESSAKERERRVTEARATAAAILALDCEIDDGMRRLREALERRSHLLGRLSATNVLQAKVIMQFMRRAAPTAAARAAGLSNFLGLDHVAPAHVKKLADADHILRGRLSPTLCE
jgi:hypothetical protein